MNVHLNIGEWRASCCKDKGMRAHPEDRGGIAKGEGRKNETCTRPQIVGRRGVVSFHVFFA
jgi:hypothetical protein